MQNNMVPKEALIAYLNDYLAIGDVPDYKEAYNGLQVDGKPNIRRVALAVDACLKTIAQAVIEGADLLIVHHGLFWGAKAPITGPYYDRLALLLKNDLAVYACHTPLDAHPEVGNNHVLARLLGFEPSGMWGKMEGVPLGIYTEVNITRDALAQRIHDTLHVVPHLIATGPVQIQRLGIVTGGAGSMIAEAQTHRIDTFLTGEGAHHTYFEAEERGMNVIYAGHYATETVGVKALGKHLEERFGLQTFFIDHPTGL